MGAKIIEMEAELVEMRLKLRDGHPKAAAV